MRLRATKPAAIPLETNLRLTTLHRDAATGAKGDEVLNDVDSYQRQIGKLMYVTTTRPDISCAIHTLSQFMQQPKRSHWEAALRVVRYLKGSPG